LRERGLEEISHWQDGGDGSFIIFVDRTYFSVTSETLINTVIAGGLHLESNYGTGCYVMD
jgi:hypothetical protein